MSFTRWWTETTAALGDHVPLPLVALLLVLTTMLASAGWYTYPAWVPRRFPRPHRFPRLRRRRRPARAPRPRRADTDPAVDLASPQPTGPPAHHVTLADRLAAEGRYDEAIRERLRGMVRELSARDLVSVRPGTTVTEIVEAAATRHPPAGPPLAAAATIFARVWYAQHPGTADHDQRVRDHAATLHRLLTDGPADSSDGAVSAGSGGVSAGSGGGEGSGEYVR
ncbi:DUF4129 domain-containing protein [Verrucosispora sp. FIM060022]|uniref:DUF4129 domain-containing protein n=1 Tax=Verrucosispora sp. FIM060022 TaxID=1479020 RepID=UPI000F865957|nr:DUF4129 domain-containing protein [Verrucosispora sp. FIM060022]RUL93267.1 DUF4129 domain-containing protein [Verrucosispora sp. FIM060022]